MTKALQGLVLYPRFVSKATAEIILRVCRWYTYLCFQGFQSTIPLISCTTSKSVEKSY
jgi:hypothetical protein